MYFQGGLQRSLSDPAKAGLAHHIVQLEACGPLDVYVQVIGIDR